MSEKDKFDAQKTKLENLCEEHKLSYSLKLDNYPVTLTLRPMQGMFEQISILEASDGNEERISQDAFLTFYSRDGDYGTKTFGTFTISETLQNKFKNIFKKLDNFWKHYFFRECIESGAIRTGFMPEIDEEAERVETDPDEGDPEENDPDGLISEEMIQQAIQLVRTENACTTSMLQRHLKLGYVKATALAGILEGRGVVGPYRGSQPREVMPYDLPDDQEATQ